ncbi:glycosyl transferase [Lentzea sp. NBRC 105346]|nr:glycosyl transferase [Lentzea sp. NBRC 105346]
MLMMPPPAASHVTAMVPLAWALRACGHEVLVAGQPDVLPVARSAGLSTVDVGEPADLTRAGQEAMPEDMFPASAFGDRHTDMGRYLWNMTAGAWVQHAEQHETAYLRVARAWRPDVVVSDSVTLVSRMVSAELDVPLVFLRWGVDPTAGPFEETAREHLSPLADPALIIDPCPPSLQVEDAAPGHRFRYVPYNGAGSLPEWATGQASRPRVCICPGTSIMALTGPGPVRRVLQALDGMDVEVVAALTTENRRMLGRVPTHVRVVESLPLNLFLGTCDVIVHHGGSGTGLTATAHGVPQLVLPQWTDQFDYGRRVGEAGAGISIADHCGQRDVDRLRRALTTLIAKPDYAFAAARLRAEMSAFEPLTEAVPLLEALVRPVSVLAGLVPVESN